MTTPEPTNAVTYNPHVNCELQGGHVWNTPKLGEDVMGNPILLSTCANCGKVRSGGETK